MIITYIDSARIEILGIITVPVVAGSQSSQSCIFNYICISFSKNITPKFSFVTKSLRTFSSLWLEGLLLLSSSCLHYLNFMYSNAMMITTSPPPLLLRIYVTHKIKSITDEVIEALQTPPKNILITITITTQATITTQDPKLREAKSSPKSKRFCTVLYVQINKEICK